MFDCGFIVGGILIIIVGIIGLCGNTAGIILFSNRKYRVKTFYGLMILLAICDNIYILAKLIFWRAVQYVLKPSYANTDWYKRFDHYSTQYLWQKIAHGAHMWTVTLSIYFTVAISIERYLVICWPFAHHTRNMSAKAYAVPIFIFSAVFNSVLPFVPDSGYEAVQDVFLLILPFVILVITNSLIVKTLIRNKEEFGVRCKVTKSSGGGLVSTISISKRSAMSCQNAKLNKRRMRNADLAIVSLTIDIIFITCHFVNSLLTSYATKNSDDLLHVSNLLVVFGSSVNFYIYLAKKFIHHN